MHPTVTINPDRLEEVCRSHDIALLRIFGSGAWDEASADSDVDFLVEFTTRKSLLDLVRAERDDFIYLRHILDSIDRIESYLDDIGEEEFQADPLLQDGVEDGSWGIGATPRWAGSGVVNTRFVTSPGESVEQVVSAHPHLTREGVQAALEYAAESLGADIVRPIA